jgi:hypothetical protein
MQRLPDDYTQAIAILNYLTERCVSFATWWQAAGTFDQHQQLRYQVQ